MGVFNIIHGYILTPHEEMDFNRKCLSGFEYDAVWPLPAVFHLPNIPVHPQVISFAMAYYGAGQDWQKWMSRFEKLLGSLHALSANIVWNRDEADVIIMDYFFSTRLSGYLPTGQNLWTKHTVYDYEDAYDYPKRHEQIEEQITI